MLTFLRRLFPPYTGGSGDTVFGISVYGSSHYDDWWFIPKHYHHYVLSPLTQMYGFVAHRTWDRYHVVKTDLTPGFHEIEDRMFSACFFLLKEFVERDLGTENYFPDKPECMYKGYRKHFADDSLNPAIDLYLWYRHDYPTLKKACWEEVNYRKRQTLLDSLEVLENAKLLELVSLRRNLTL